MHSPRQLFVWVLALAGAMGARDARAQDKWDYELTPYLWASGLNGRQEIGGIGADVDASFSDLLEVLNLGLFLRFSAHHEPVSWYAEASYVDLEQDGLGPRGNTQIRVTQTLGEAGLSYWFNESFSVYGGIRYEGLDTRLRAGSVDVSDHPNWVDGLAGAQWTPLHSDRWRWWLRGDVGGGGSKLAWLAETGVGYSWSDSYAGYLTYRILDTDYEKDDFIYDMQQAGFLLGFGFRF